MWLTLFPTEPWLFDIPIAGPGPEIVILMNNGRADIQFNQQILRSE